MKRQVPFTQAAVNLVLIGAWEYGAAVGAFDPRIFPSPSQVILAMRGLLQSGAFMADASHVSSFDPASSDPSIAQRATQQDGVGRF